jgi:hypothetical protein
LKWTEGKIGHFLVRTHLSELTNGANLTESGRNGLLVKKNLLDGLDVQYKFSVAWMSNTSFLMGCMSKARGRMHEGVARWPRCFGWFRPSLSLFRSKGTF